MSALEEFEHRVTGLEFKDPDQYDAWLETVVLPKKQQRIAEAIGAQWRTQLSNALMSRLTTDTTAIAERWSKTEAQNNDSIRHLLDVTRQAETGRLSSADLLKEVNKSARQRAQALEVQTSLHAAVERWEAMSDGSAEDFHAERRTRFAATPGTLRLTGAMLAGEAESPFSKAGN